ncbi:MAG: PEP-CTERM sorting domain-containing protein [Verrucomicrobia bacterium]|nr:PEP-CTERM sorting domain-containing protein [Verrucomicrobiota bacterium]
MLRLETVMWRQPIFVLLGALCALAGGLHAQTVVLTPNTPVLNPAGGTLTFTATLSYATPPAVLAFTTTLPSGWTYLSTSGPSSLNAPPANTSGTLNWFYTPPTPGSPASFTFDVSYPGSLTGLQPLSTTSVTRETVNSNTATTTAGPTVSVVAPTGLFTWVGDGSGNGDWNTAANWTPNGVPNATGAAIIAAQINSGTATISSGISVTLQSLVLAGGTLNNLGTVTLKDASSAWTGGVITGAGQLINSSGAQFAASGTASHDFNGQTLANQGSFVWTGAGNLRSGGGGAILNASGAKFIDASSTGTTTATRMTASGFTGNFTFTNAGVYQKTGAGETKVEIPFTNTGTVIVSAGNLHFDTTFALNGGVINVATGATTQLDLGLTVNPGATLIGGGTVQGNVTVGAATGSQALVSPGDTIGTLTIQGNLTLLATSTLLIDLAGTGQGSTFDHLSVSGTATVGGNLNLSLAQSFPLYNLPAGTQFTVLTAGTLTGAFSNAANGTRLTTTAGDGSFLVNYAGNSVVLSNFVPIPEPSTYALLACGLGALALVAHRRKR